MIRCRSRSGLPFTIRILVCLTLLPASHVAIILTTTTTTSSSSSIRRHARQPPPQAIPLAHQPSRVGVPVPQQGVLLYDPILEAEELPFIIPRPQPQPQEFAAATTSPRTPTTTGTTTTTATATSAAAAHNGASHLGFGIAQRPHALGTVRAREAGAGSEALFDS